MSVGSTTLKLSLRSPQHPLSLLRSHTGKGDRESHLFFPCSSSRVTNVFHVLRPDDDENVEEQVEQLVNTRSSHQERTFLSSPWSPRQYSLVAVPCTALDSSLLEPFLSHQAQPQGTWGPSLLPGDQVGFNHQGKAQPNHLVLEDGQFLLSEAQAPWRCATPSSHPKFADFSLCLVSHL